MVLDLIWYCSHLNICFRRQLGVFNMVLVESFSKKVKMSKGTHQPDIRTESEFSRILRNISTNVWRVIFNNINCGEHLGFHVPKDILSSKTREQSNGQAYDALRYSKCIKCISDATMQLFCATFCRILQLFAICFKLKKRSLPSVG